MKKGDGSVLTDDEISELSHLLNVLGKYIEKFEDAYHKKDPTNFNLLKKDILMIQRKIQSIAK